MKIDSCRVYVEYSVYALPWKSSQYYVNIPFCTYCYGCKPMLKPFLYLSPAYMGSHIQLHGPTIRIGLKIIRKRDKKLFQTPFIETAVRQHAHQMGASKCLHNVTSPVF